MVPDADGVPTSAEYESEDVNSSPRHETKSSGSRHPSSLIWVVLCHDLYSSAQSRWTSVDLSGSMFAFLGCFIGLKE